MRVSLRPAAHRDLLQQVDYLLEEFAYRAAERFPDAMEEALSFVSAHPDAGSPVLELRSWPVPGFPRIRVYYLMVSPTELHVVRILHDARDVGTILGDEEVSG